jgi:hypothetical protein
MMHTMREIAGIEMPEYLGKVLEQNSGDGSALAGGVSAPADTPASITQKPKNGASEGTGQGR